MKLKEKYGQLALVAGASEGLGAAFSRYLAKEGFDVILVARREEPLKALAKELSDSYTISSEWISCDLARLEAAREIMEQVGTRKIDLMVYNAAISYIGKFEDHSPEQTTKMSLANMVTPMNLIHAVSPAMLQQGAGAIVLMGSLAGFQGSGYLSAYAATKAFNLVLGEGLWYEWRKKGVDVMTCCAGATSTPNYLNTQPGKTSIFAPRVQRPEEVVAECFRKLGRKPSIVTGGGNKFASFLMQRLMPRKAAVKTMGDNTQKMYGIDP